jgi:futalosine hydrolase
MKLKYEICGMQILLIAATEEEIKTFADTSPGIDILITGSGIPSSLYHLQKRMHQIDYDLIIQAGIAGSFNTQLIPGSVVLVKQDAFADLGMEEKENFTPIFETALADKNEFPFSEGWLINTSQLLKTSSLTAVKGVTVNKVSDSKLQKQQLIDKFNPDIETMEGAVLHYVCLQENVPFLQLRSVSNLVGERDKSKWKIKEAIDSLNAELSKLINQLTN